jgi:hypothetical protein
LFFEFNVGVEVRALAGLQLVDAVLQDRNDILHEGSKPTK